MKTPRMPTPTAAEIAATDQANAEATRRQQQLDAEEARLREQRNSAEASALRGTTGTRSLLSGDWSGFQRADLSAR